MTPDERTMKNGTKILVGDWQAEFIVNAFSNDLAHIPASEFKSEDGKDFSALTFSFFKDHTAKINTGEKEFGGKWEQTGDFDFRLVPEPFEELPESEFLKAAENLSLVDGRLCFSIAFLGVYLKKTRDGEITEEPDVGDAEPSEDDAKLNAVVGRYAVSEVFGFVGGATGTYTREEIEADVKKKIASGEADESELSESLQAFDAVIEFTADHKIYEWMKLPDGAEQSDIDAALQAGEIDAVENGYFRQGEKQWKAVNGKYYYDTGEERELFGEKQSSWDELRPDGDGTLPFASGMMKLKKI